MADTKITGLTATTAPLTTDILPIVTDPGGTPATKKVTIASLITAMAVPSGGWLAADAMTYAAADAPTFTMTCTGDQTAKYTPGMRVKLTQTTVKYFIVTVVAYGAPNTTITLYGGTDYTLANEAITSPFYSSAKAPTGFPLNPVKWTVSTTGTTSYVQQGSPTSATWYNMETLSIAIPIGAWRVWHNVTVQANKTAATTMTIQSTLSTANNSSSDGEFTSTASANTTQIGAELGRQKYLTLTAKTTYYQNEFVEGINVEALYTRGDYHPSAIRAVCAYL